MAFIKSNEKTNAVSAAEVNPIVSIPLIYTKESDGFHGFVPTITKNDIIALDLNECHKTTLNIVKNTIVEMLKNNQPIPFFFSDEEIKQEWHNVVAIKRISVDTTKFKK